MINNDPISLEVEILARNNNVQIMKVKNKLLGDGK